MIRKLLRLFSTKSAMDEMYGEFNQMFEKVEWMFRTGISMLIGDETAKESTKETKNNIYTKDKEVNEHERNIRRRIITHLSLNSGDNVPACMILMSIVKDAERIGDYCKNILELNTMSNIVLDRGRYKTPIRELADKVESLFNTTRKALHSSDESLARRAVDEGNRINTLCDMLVKQLAADNIPTGKAVVYTLAVRYIKRVSSHLANIATSVASSIENLDFDIEPKQ